MTPFVPSARTTVRRLPARGVYDREAVHAILDEAFLCHVGFVADGSPVVIPTAYGRAGDILFIHGSPASRMLRGLAKGIDVCVTITLLDGLVLARSAFHHSFNYRSVVIFGRAELVEGEAEKLEAMRVFTEHVAPGRWATVRVPNERELKATTVLSLRLDEVSAKIRTGPPIDDEEDLNVQVWAGVLPLRMAAGVARPDSHTPGELEPYAAPVRFRP